MNASMLRILQVTPTTAMKRGDQLIFQCAHCGLVAVETGLAPGPLGPCPACSHRHWHRQQLPVAGLSEVSA